MMTYGPRVSAGRMTATTERVPSSKNPDDYYYKHKGGYHRYLTARPHSDERWPALRLRRRGRVAGEL